MVPKICPYYCNSKFGGNIEKNTALFSAVYFEQGKYDECIEECNKAITLGREQMAGFKIIGR